MASFWQACDSLGGVRDAWEAKRGSVHAESATLVAFGGLEAVAECEKRITYSAWLEWGCHTDIRYTSRTVRECGRGLTFPSAAHMPAKLVTGFSDPL